MTVAPSKRKCRACNLIPIPNTYTQPINCSKCLIVYFRFKKTDYSFPLFPSNKRINKNICYVSYVQQPMSHLIHISQRQRRSANTQFNNIHHDNGKPVQHDTSIRCSAKVECEKKAQLF